MKVRILKWGLYLCLGTLLGAGLAIVHFFEPELQAWAQVPSTIGEGKVLPIPEPVTKPITEIDARNAKAPPRFEVKPPKGAPNIVIVLLDDIGYAHSSAFGGPIPSKTAERLMAKKRPEIQSFLTCPHF